MQQQAEHWTLLDRDCPTAAKDSSWSQTSDWSTNIYIQVIIYNKLNDKQKKTISAEYIDIKIQATKKQK